MDDLEKLLAKATDAIQRDINHIWGEVSAKKLSPTSARDLSNYYKLLKDMVDAQSKEAKGLQKLSQEELEAEARKLLK